MSNTEHLSVKVYMAFSKDKVPGTVWSKSCSSGVSFKRELHPQECSMFLLCAH